MNSNPEHLIFRKFIYIRCRLLNRLQSTLAKREQELQLLDERDEAEQSMALNTIQVNELEAAADERHQLFQTMKAELTEYGSVVNLVATYSY